MIYQSANFLNKKVSALYGWQKQFKVTGFTESKVSSLDKWSDEEKFSVVLETATLSEVDISEYCRTLGLYPEQIKAWKQACIAGNSSNKQLIDVIKTSLLSKLKFITREKYFER